MIQDAPNWWAIGIATSCLFAFGGFWLLPESRTVRRAVPRRIHVEIIRPERPAPPLLDLQEGPPRPLEWLDPAKPASRWSLLCWQALRRS